MFVEPKISIVMPVYNAINYIEKTIQSIMAQKYYNYELIIIDDGATDGTSDICKRYAANYKNIIYMRQNNKGTSAARNYGISLSSGEYICFSDHDDEYDADYLNIMSKNAVEENAELVKCGVSFYEEYSYGVVKRKELFEDRVLSINDLINDYNKLPICFFGVWNTIFRTDLIKKNHISFPVNMRHGQEDFYFMTSLIPYLNIIVFTHDCLYKHYRRLSQSISAVFYKDRIDALQLYYKKEIQVLKPLIYEKKWINEYMLIYGRKITGLLSYCLSTLDNDSKNKCILYIDKFISECPYQEKFSPIVIIKNPKYGLIVLCALRKYYKLLVNIWWLYRKNQCRLK